MAIRHGASALGFVSAMPSGPGPIPEELITEIVAQVPPPIATFLLTCRQDAASIIEQQRRTRVNTLQLVDHLPESELQQLRRALPGVALVQVIHVEGAESLEEAEGVAPHVDAILLDSGRPKAAVKELGGTGRVHDWSTSAQIRQAVSVPVFLAGGLTPDNVREAVERVQPFGLDVCTGLRTNGSLDEEKLAKFFRAIGDQENPTMEASVLEQLVDMLEAGRRDVIESVASLGDADAGKKPAPERWSPLEIIEHVVIAESRYLSWLEESPVLDSPQRDPQREAWITTHVADRGWDWQSPPVGFPTGKFRTVAGALSEFNAMRDRTIAAAKMREPVLFSVQAKHSVLGVLNGAELLRLAAGHASRHAVQIRLSR